MSVRNDAGAARPASMARRAIVRLAASITRRWPFRRGGYRLASLAARPRQFAMAFRRPFFGQTYEGDIGNYIDWWVYFFGAYESDEVALLRRLAQTERDAGRSPVVYVDVGANVGHHALAMAPLVDRVVAIEPYPPFRSALARRTAHLTNCEIVGSGLGDAHERRAYRLYDATQTGHFSPGADGEPFDLVPGDALLSGAVSIVKIDVDGFEDRVLAGLKETLQRCRPWVLVEWSPASHSLPAQLPYVNAALFGLRDGRWRPLAELPLGSTNVMVIAPLERLSDLQWTIELRSA